MTGPILIHEDGATSKEVMIEPCWLFAVETTFVDDTGKGRPDVVTLGVYRSIRVDYGSHCLKPVDKMLKARNGKLFSRDEPETDPQMMGGKGILEMWFLDL